MRKNLKNNTLRLKLIALAWHRCSQITVQKQDAVHGTGVLKMLCMAPVFSLYKSKMLCMAPVFSGTGVLQYEVWTKTRLQELGEDHGCSYFVAPWRYLGFFPKPPAWQFSVGTARRGGRASAVWTPELCNSWYGYPARKDIPYEAYGASVATHEVGHLVEMDDWTGRVPGLSISNNGPAPQRIRVTYSPYELRIEIERDDGSIVTGHGRTDTLESLGKLADDINRSCSGYSVMATAHDGGTIWGLLWPPKALTLYECSSRILKPGESMLLERSSDTTLMETKNRKYWRHVLRRFADRTEDQYPRETGAIALTELD